MRRLLIAATLFLLVPVPALAGGGGGGHVAQCPGFDSGTSISMFDSCFSGTAHFAPSETTITIRNDGALPHSYTAVDGSFDTGQLEAGETAEVTVDEPGVYEVFCSLHGTADGGGMAGVLLVGEAEVGPVAAQLNLDEIRQAVSDATGPLADRLDSQAALIGSLTTAQAHLTESIDVHDSAQATDSAPATEPTRSAGQLTWLLITAGAAAGLGIAALVAMVSNRRKPTAAPGESWQPSLEA